ALPRLCPARPRCRGAPMPKKPAKAAARPAPSPATRHSLLDHAPGSGRPPVEDAHGRSGELHQHLPAAGAQAATPAAVTDTFGHRIADSQISLRVGVRGPPLLEDFVLREKIFHFDHARIPERIVHARGSGAHGVFECTRAIPELTRASIFPAAGSTCP